MFTILKYGMNSFTFSPQFTRPMSYNKFFLDTLTNISKENLDKSNFTCTNLKNHKVFLIGEDPNELEATKLSFKLTLKAAQNQIAYFHEGVPQEDPYQKIYITNFFHRPMLNGLSLEDFGLTNKGFNYGLEATSFFVPHYLAFYYKELYQGNEMMIDLLLSDIIHITEIHGPLKTLALEVDKIAIPNFSMLSYLFSYQLGHPDIFTAELDRIKSMIQSIQNIIDTTTLPEGFIPAEEYQKIKKIVGNHNTESWALLAKHLLNKVCLDLKREGLLSPVLEGAYYHLMIDPKDTEVRFRWMMLSLIARDEIFVDRLCEIVPHLPEDLGVYVSLRNNHVRGIARLLDNIQNKTLPKMLMPPPYLTHIIKIVAE